MQRPQDPIAQRTLFVKNLLHGYALPTRSDWNIKGEDIYELFGRYGGIRQVRIGTDQKLGTKGTAYIVYESPDDAKEAITHLNGFNFSGRYIVVLYHHPSKQQASAIAKAEIRAREQALADEKRRLGLHDEV